MIQAPIPDAAALRALVQPSRVHRSVYSDPSLFELEMQRLWGRAWLFVAHDSQLKNPGDFITTRLAREPVIVVRQDDGSVKVLINRCTHRGALVCAEECGNAKRFVCCYHGWAFRPNGDLIGVPVPDGYEKGFDARKARDLGLAEVPRVASYRGFIFASLGASGPSLDDHLGYIRTSIDDLVDRAPDGEVEMAGGVFKHTYDGNWKLTIENHIDTVHPRFVHASSVAVANAQTVDPHTDGAGDIGRRQMRQNGMPPDVWEKLGVWTTGRGHVFMGDYHDDKKLVTANADPVNAEYRRRLAVRVGEERMQKILSVQRFNTIIYPNVSFMSQFGQFRVVHPISVDRTAVYAYVFRFKGAPDEMFRRSIAFANVVNGTGSLVLTDDLETYGRVQTGLGAQGSEWVDLSRGAERDVVDQPGVNRGATGTSEIGMRHQLSAWVDYMTAEG